MDILGDRGMNEKPKTPQTKQSLEKQFIRLDEIAHIQENLHRERALLLRERPWYLKPGNWMPTKDSN